MPILLKVFQKIAEEGTLPKLFYNATITLISKPDQDNTHTKINIQKSLAFPYTKNEKPEREIREIISFTIATENKMSRNKPT